MLNSLPSVMTATITGRGVSFLTKPFDVSISASSRYMPEPGWANRRLMPRFFSRAISVVASTWSVGRSPSVMNATECPAPVSRVANGLRRVAQELDRPGRRLAVVDEQRDPHRIGGRRHRQDLAGDAVLADDEVGRGDVGHRGALLVDEAGVDLPRLALGADGHDGGRERQRPSPSAAAGRAIRTVEPAGRSLGLKVTRSVYYRHGVPAPGPGACARGAERGRAVVRPGHRHRGRRRRLARPSRSAPRRGASWSASPSASPPAS